MVGGLAAVDGTPAIFVALIAAQEIETRGPLGTGLLNCMADNQRSRAQPRQRWIETAEVGVGRILRGKSVTDRQRGAIDRQPVEAQHSGGQQAGRGRAMKTPYLGVA